MRAGFLCLCIPTLIGIGGVFFLSFGLLHTMMLTTLGLGSGVMNAMVPMLKRQRAQLVPGPTSHPETVSAPPAAVSAQPSVASSQPSAMSQPVPVVSGSMAHAVPLMAER
jgi:predicted lipid-binding transport protein (Tim44 family)